MRKIDHARQLEMNQPATSESELEIHLLGATRIVVDGVLIEDRAWTRRKSKALVRLLALAPAHQLQLS